MFVVGVLIGYLKQFITITNYCCKIVAFVFVFFFFFLFYSPSLSPSPLLLTKSFLFSLFSFLFFLSPVLQSSLSLCVFVVGVLIGYLKRFITITNYCCKINAFVFVFFFFLFSFIFLLCVFPSPSIELNLLCKSVCVLDCEWTPIYQYIQEIVC